MRRADQRQQLLLLVIIFLPVEVFFVFTHHGFFPLPPLGVDVLLPALRCVSPHLPCTSAPPRSPVSNLRAPWCFAVWYVVQDDVDVIQALM
jgi:hypothetical protein